MLTVVIKGIMKFNTLLLKLIIKKSLNRRTYNPKGQTNTYMYNAKEWVTRTSLETWILPE
jgi:hypothetical protein